MAKKIDAGGHEWKQTRRGWVNQSTGAVAVRSSDIPIQRKRRSDRKSVSQNNVVTVALRLLHENEIALVTVLDAVYADTGSLEVLEMLTLIAATRDALSDIVFLAAFCQPSSRFYRDKSELALRLAYKFIIEFYPDEISNVDNRNAATFRTRRVHREYQRLDDGSNSELNFKIASSVYVDSIEL